MDGTTCVVAARPSNRGQIKPGVRRRPVVLEARKAGIEIKIVVALML